jgi:AraC-like DNA-binding protein
VRVNVVCPRQLGAAAERRFASDAPGPWPWGPGCGERVVRLPAPDQAWLAGWIRDLQQKARAGARLAAESFVLDLARRAALAGTARGRNAMPDWLAAAVDALDEPAALAAGVAGLAKRTGRTREHLGRMVRRFLGCTTVELVARRRLDHAARRLLGSDLPISAIASECGYDSVSHFHARFRSFHRCTPEAYRRGRQVSTSV